MQSRDKAADDIDVRLWARGVILLIALIINIYALWLRSNAAAE